MTRCHDTYCHVRERCQRWQHRADRGPGIRHAGTLRPLWQLDTRLCSRAIRARWPDQELIKLGPAGWLVYGWLYGFAPRDVYQALLRPQP